MLLRIKLNITLLSKCGTLCGVARECLHSPPSVARSQKMETEHTVCLKGSEDGSKSAKPLELLLNTGLAVRQKQKTG